MRRPSYASVVATLALVVALGGTSYAAVKVTGKDVKKQSVPLDRLSGTLATLDPDQFVPAAGLYTVSAGPGAWQAGGPGLTRAINTFGRWQSTGSGSAAVMLDPALPTTIAGRPTRLRAVTACGDATAAGILITAVYVTAWRDDANATVTDAVELADEVDHDEKTCKRYEFATPVVHHRQQPGQSAQGRELDGRGTDHAGWRHLRARPVLIARTAARYAGITPLGQPSVRNQP